MNKINKYNKEVQNWDFEEEQLPELLKLLTERNLFIQEKTPLVDFHSEYMMPSKNEAVTNSKGIKILENIAFHVGYPHQKKLYSLVDEETENPSNIGVFFSLNPKDVSYFSEFNKKPFSMVYFSDIGLAKDVRIQKNYDSSTVSRHDLENLYDLDYMIDTFEVEERDIRILHDQFNKEWIKQNTLPFEAKKLKYFRKKGLDWLVIPDPIEVKY